MSKKTTSQSLDLFRNAVESTPDIATAYNKGLQAIDAKDKTYFKVKDTNLIDGSVNIDKTTHALYPRDNRWDYVVGYNAKAYYVEVHPANTSNIPEMLRKLEWLKMWLKNKAPQLASLPSGNPKYNWIATSAGVHITKTSPQSRQLAQMGLLPKRVMQLND